MNIEQIRTAFAWTDWADNRVLAMAGNLTVDQFLAPTINGDWSIRDTFVHYMSAQSLWLERWQGRSPRSLDDPLDYPDSSAIAARWKEINAATLTYLERLNPAELQKPHSYVNFIGQTWTYDLWQMIFDLFNHSTQHRSEIALQLTNFGHSPGDLDFLVYLDTQEMRNGS